MTHLYPQRPSSHQLERLSELYLENLLPHNWTAEKPRPDYGVDLKIEMPEGDSVTGLELLVQLKASAAASHGNYERIVLDVSTYNLLWNKLQVVMLVKYIKEKDEAYWILLSEVPKPNEEQETFTVRIPKDRLLKNIDWQRIQDYAREVTNDKLASRRLTKLRYHHVTE